MFWLAKKKLQPDEKFDKKDQQEYEHLSELSAAEPERIMEDIENDLISSGTVPDLENMYESIQTTSSQQNENHSEQG